ncbi:hypothetical protein AVDCRST_MAG92-3437, partial [uncultured Coleofasciculus sp.]
AITLRDSLRAITFVVMLKQAISPSKAEPTREKTVFTFTLLTRS